MEILNRVDTLDQRAIDHIVSTLLGAFYKKNDRYPINVEGVIIDYVHDSLGTITATLYRGAGEGLTRKFNEARLMDKSVKLPKYF